MATLTVWVDSELASTCQLLCSEGHGESGNAPACMQARRHVAGEGHRPRERTAVRQEHAELWAVQVLLGQIQVHGPSRVAAQFGG